MGYVSLNLGRISVWYYIIAFILLCGILYVTRKLSIALLAPYMFLILAATTLVRSSSPTAQYAFNPFASYRRAFASSDMWWEVFCNVMMAVPIGFLLPAAIDQIKGNTKFRKKLLITLLIGTCFSVGIEALQFFLHRGYSETDDVISSLIGLLIGFAVYSLLRLIILWISSWVRKET